MGLLLCDFSILTLGQRKGYYSHFSDGESVMVHWDEGIGEGAWVIWLLIHFSFGYAKDALDFQMG